MKYNLKRFIIFLIIVLIITITAFIVPIAINSIPFSQIKILEIFFPLLGFLIWLLYFINLEMYLRIDYKLLKAILSAFTSCKSIKIYKKKLTTDKTSGKWLYKLFYFVLISLIISLITFIIIQFI